MQVSWFTFLAIIPVATAAQVFEPVPSLEGTAANPGLAMAPSPRRERKQLASANDGIRG
jgi:hypothetical protein